MRRYFRFSVHTPFVTDSMWVAGKPEALKVVNTINRSARYEAASVPYVLASLQMAQPPGTVITVY